MKFTTCDKLPIRPGTKVLVRLDWNVPLNKQGKIDHAEDYKIARSMPTLEWLRKQGAVVIITTHLGRPDGQVVPKYSVKPVANYLRVKYKLPLQFLSEPIGSQELTAKIAGLKNGQMVLLENIRFYSGEEKNDPKFARDLAKLAEFYINDAFAVSHRAHASVERIAKILPAAAGMLFAQEVQELSSLLSKPKKPYLVILGGAKMSTKVGLIRAFCNKADTIFVGGGIANTLLVCQGGQVGKSICEHTSAGICNHLVTKNCWKKLMLPTDVRVGKSLAAKKPETRLVTDIKKYDIIGDVGPETVKKIVKIVSSAKTIVWNGPLGYFENPEFIKGSKLVAQAVAKSKAYSVSGGGETIQLIRQLKLDNRFSFLSTGGGAMLEFLEGKKLPGVEALRSKAISNKQ